MGVSEVFGQCTEEHQRVEERGQQHRRMGAQAIQGQGRR